MVRGVFRTVIRPSDISFIQHLLPFWARMENLGLSDLTLSLTQLFQSEVQTTAGCMFSAVVAVTMLSSVGSMDQTMLSSGSVDPFSLHIYIYFILNQPWSRMFLYRLAKSSLKGTGENSASNMMSIHRDDT